MAKLPQGIMGPFIGRLGTAVGYVWNGKCVARSYNPHVRNPRTPEQVAHREMFKQEVQLAARMRWAVTRSMTDAARAEGITSYNLFVRENQHAFAWSTTAGSEPAQRATEGALQVDYSTLRLSVGDVAPVVAEEATVSEDNVLDVRFSRGTGRGFDEVYLYVYVPELGKGFLSSSVYRRDKRITLALPDDFAGHELHAWLMVKSDDGRWSESTYVDFNILNPQNILNIPDNQIDPNTQTLLGKRNTPEGELFGGEELAEGVVAVNEEHTHQTPPMVRD